MGKLIWTDAFSVGVEEIDRQHQEFVRLIGRLQTMQELKSPHGVILRILRELLKYADFHFESEENLMVLVKYPELDQHREEHKHLLKTAEAMTAAFASGKEPVESVLDFLADWFALHTQSSDKAAGRFINQVANNRPSVGLDLPK